MKCRHCAQPLQHTFLDLGFAPPSNAYLSAADLHGPEVYFPLKLKVCEHCWLVQTEDYTRADALFRDDYAYFSSTSSSWLRHAADYCTAMTDRLGLTSASHVIEVACNDGYLLKNFVQAQIPCLGIEPTAGTAAAAEQLGIPVIKEFFGASLGEQLSAAGKSADLIAGNNVYAHVPDINDFTAGLKAALKPTGTITLEFPHLLQLIKHNQFDTVYHEHFSYLSLHTVSKIFAAQGLRVYDVEQLSTHGGSLRVYGCHEASNQATLPQVDAVLALEQQAGLQRLASYQGFQRRVDEAKDQLLLFLLEQKRQGKQVAAYGAAAKGNTLLNYAGVRPDLLTCVADAAPSKQGKFMPGSHIPIIAPAKLLAANPACVLILPWNIATEVISVLQPLKDNNCRFVAAIPHLHDVGTAG